MMYLGQHTWMNTNNIDEFKTILALSGNNRLPQCETGIFDDNELTTIYLYNLCKDYAWFIDHWPSSSYNANTAYHYAVQVLKSRWPEAEALISSKPHVAYCYATYVIKGRWPEAEESIANDPLIDKFYKRDFNIFCPE